MALKVDEHLSQTTDNAILKSQSKQLQPAIMLDFLLFSSPTKNAILSTQTAIFCRLSNLWITLVTPVFSMLHGLSTFAAMFAPTISY